MLISWMWLCDNVPTIWTTRFIHLFIYLERMSVCLRDWEMKARKFRHEMCVNLFVTVIVDVVFTAMKLQFAYFSLFNFISSTSTIQFALISFSSFFNIIQPRDNVSTIEDIFKRRHWAETIFSSFKWIVSTHILILFQCNHLLYRLNGVFA
jgi:hypothetical protein